MNSVYSDFYVRAVENGYAVCRNGTDRRISPVFGEADGAWGWMEAMNYM